MLSQVPVTLAQPVQLLPVYESSDHTEHQSFTPHYTLNYKLQYRLALSCNYNI